MIKEKPNSDKLTRIKLFLLGSNDKKGFLVKVFCYALLVLFGFVYLYPMLYMLSYSLMDSVDVIDSSVQYVPTHLYFGNYLDAARVIDFWSTLGSSMLVSILPALLQTVSAALVAYALARLKFRGRKLIFVLVLVTFIVPPQITMIPQVLVYSQMKLTDTIFAYLVPALLGQGIKSAVFILVFYQHYKNIPASLEEAAKIDGAKPLDIFFKIAVVMVLPAFLLSFLLSFVWYFNETTLATVMLGGKINTLPLQLERFQAAYETLFGAQSDTGKTINEAVYMAGTNLSILPLVIIYLITQRFFIQGVDTSGITGT